MKDYSQNEKILFNLGYNINKDGTCIGKHGKILTGTISKYGYRIISIRLKDKSIKVSVHRFQAFLKFGDKIYDEKYEIRHLDCNKLNNSWDNIEIGTHSQNMMDIPKEIRINTASNAHKKYSDELILEIKEYRILGHSYKEIMKKYNISSKGTLSYIINSR